MPMLSIIYKEIKKSLASFFVLSYNIHIVKYSQSQRIASHSNKLYNKFSSYIGHSK